MIGELLGATISCRDVEHVVEAYQRALGYRGEIERVGEAAARRWHAGETQGLPMASLRPEAGGSRFVRFIECLDAVAPAVHRTVGWNAVELIVQDLDRLAEQLDRDPGFSIIGPPAVLEFDFTDRIRAMQVLGPAGELLYFTAVDGPVPGFDLPTARCPVDAPFVAILGTTKLAKSADWYGKASGVEITTFDAPVAVISAAHGMSADVRHRLATVALPRASLIEIDELPVATTSTRSIMQCGLPTGIAIVTVAGSATRPQMLQGPGGERVETVPLADA